MDSTRQVYVCRLADDTRTDSVEDEAVTYIDAENKTTLPRFSVYLTTLGCSLQLSIPDAETVNLSTRRLANADEDDRRRHQRRRQIRPTELHDGS